MEVKEVNCPVVEMRKPRVWTLGFQFYDMMSGSQVHSIVKGPKINVNEEIEVIEKAAYDTLLQEYKEAIEVLKLVDERWYLQNPRPNCAIIFRAALGRVAEFLQKARHYE